jgi:hypothetical protein
MSTNLAGFTLRADVQDTDYVVGYRSAISGGESRTLVSVLKTAFWNSPTLVTPTLGTPASGTLTNTTGFPAANLAGTALPAAIVSSSLTSVGTIATGVWNATAIADGKIASALTGKTINGNTLTTGTWTLTGAAAKTLTFSNSLTLAGTDATTLTFPTTSATIARTDAAQTFTGTQTFGAIIGNSLTSVAGNALVLATGTSGTALSIASATNIPTFTFTGNSRVFFTSSNGLSGVEFGSTSADNRWQIENRGTNNSGAFWISGGTISGGTTQWFGMALTTGVATFNATTDASALGTASVVLSGGLSVAKSIISGGALTTLGGNFLHATSSALTAGATGNVPTLTAGPVTGNPTKWIAINDNGTTRYIPTW